MKAVSGVGAVAALAALAVNYSSSESSSLFLTNPMGEEYSEFATYCTEWGKTYGTREEYGFRFAMFLASKKQMAIHNNQNGHGSTVDYNQFSDWTNEEYKKLLGYKPEEEIIMDSEKLDDSNLSDTVNWVTKGAVNKVKNQGHCGSCWAFSTTGAVEAAMFIKSGKLESYSEQQLVDCQKVSHGCEGGSFHESFKYVETQPLMLEGDYPYKGMQGRCRYQQGKGDGKVSAFQHVQTNSLSQFKAAISKQPISVSIEADQDVFRHYKSGIITTGCGSHTDHAVLAVGYGTEKGQDYFLVKNSWGASWGDNGYVKIAPTQCAIMSHSYYPTE